MSTEEELIGWIDGLAPWETFFTGTTRYCASNRSLQKTYERFMKNNYPQISYVYTLEPHSVAGFHVHAMFDEGHDVKWRDFWALWFERYGRAKTEPMNHKADVASYVTKYICKSHGIKKRNWQEEIWWNVHLTQYRKRMRPTVNNGSSQHIERRAESWPKPTGYQMAFGSN